MMMTEGYLFTPAAAANPAVWADGIVFADGGAAEATSFALIAVE